MDSLRGLDVGAGFFFPVEPPTIRFSIFESCYAAMEADARTYVVPAVQEGQFGSIAPPGQIQLQALLQPEVVSETPRDPAAEPVDESSQPSQPLGRAPEDNRYLFLRSATVLLSPGQMQVDDGIEYVWFEATRTLPLAFAPNPPPPPPSTFELAKERLRFRRLFVPAAVRYGLTERMQLFATLPFGFADFERSSALGDTNTSMFGMGDINFGFSYLLRRGDWCTPDLIGTLGFSAPTGKGFIDPNPDRAVSGIGFWSVSANLLWIKSYDPAVVFYGIGYRHQFARDFTFFGGEVQPGEQLNYTFGVGFSLNDSLTLSTIFTGAYQTEFQLNGANLPNTNIEPMSVRLALTALNPCDVIYEPFVRFGITPDAPQADIGVIITRTF